MGKYWVLGPALVQKGNKVIRFRKASSEAVNIDDAVAAELGDKVRAVGEPGPEVEAEGKPKSDDSGATASQQASKAAQSSQKGAAKK